MLSSKIFIKKSFKFILVERTQKFELSSKLQILALKLNWLDFQLNQLQNGFDKFDN